MHPASAVRSGITAGSRASLRPRSRQVLLRGCEAGFTAGSRASLRPRSDRQVLLRVGVALVLEKLDVGLLPPV